MPMQLPSLDELDTLPKLLLHNAANWPNDIAMREKEFGNRIVPIIPDEARTFGMDAFFPTLKIYNPHGQSYTPVDHDLMLSYREATDGHILHEGISEAGSLADRKSVV